MNLDPPGGNGDFSVLLEKVKTRLSAVTVHHHLSQSVWATAPDGETRSPTGHVMCTDITTADRMR